MHPFLERSEGQEIDYALFWNLRLQRRRQAELDEFELTGMMRIRA